MFGPIGHKAKGTEGLSSVVASVEKHCGGFDAVYRLSAYNTLKIIKASFRRASEQGIDDGVVAAA